MPNYSPVVQGIQGKVTEPEYVDTSIRMDLSGLKELGSVIGNMQKEEAIYEAKLSQAEKQKEIDLFERQLKLNREARAQESHEWAREKFNFAVNAEQRAQATFQMKEREFERGEEKYQIGRIKDVGIIDYSQKAADIYDKGRQLDWSEERINTELRNLQDSIFSTYSFGGVPAISYGEMELENRKITGVDKSTSGYYIEQQRANLKEAVTDAKTEMKNRITNLRQTSGNATNGMSDEAVYNIDKSTQAATRNIQMIQATPEGQRTPGMKEIFNGSLSTLGMTAASLEFLNTLNTRGMYSPEEANAIYNQTVSTMIQNGMDYNEATVRTNVLWDILGIRDKTQSFENTRKAIETTAENVADLTTVVSPDTDAPTIAFYKQLLHSGISDEYKTALMQELSNSDKLQDFMKYSANWTTKYDEALKNQREQNKAYNEAFGYYLNLYRSGDATPEQDAATTTQLGAAIKISNNTTTDGQETIRQNYGLLAEVSDKVNENKNSISLEDKKNVGKSLTAASTVQIQQTKQNAKDAGLELYHDEEGYVYGEKKNDLNTGERFVYSYDGEAIQNSISDINKVIKNMSEISEDVNPGEKPVDNRIKVVEENGITYKPRATYEKPAPGFLSSIRGLLTMSVETVKSFKDFPKLAKYAWNYNTAETNEEKDAVLKEAEKYYNSLSQDEQTVLDNQIKKATMGREAVERSTELLPTALAGIISGEVYSNIKNIHDTKVAKALEKLAESGASKEQIKQAAKIMGKKGLSLTGAMFIASMTAELYDILPDSYKKALEDTAIANWLGDNLEGIFTDTAGEKYSLEDRANALKFAIKNKQYGGSLLQRKWFPVRWYLNSSEYIDAKEIDKINSNKELKDFIKNTDNKSSEDFISKTFE